MDKPTDSPLGETTQIVVPHKGRFMRRLRNYFLTGVVVTGPIGITVWLALQVVNIIDGAVTNLLPDRYSPENFLPVGVPGVGVLILLIGLTIIGFFTANLLGRTLIRFGERLVDRMPVVRSIYGALKQIFETVLAQSSTSFREVVMVEYPRHGLWALAFVTGETKGEVQNLLTDDVVNIFLPTTPNPTSGFLLFVPRRTLIPLHMTVEEGIKLVISGGLVTPPDPRPREEQEQALIPPVGNSEEGPKLVGQPERK
jgi:uncharacterized membrane protein